MLRLDELQQLFAGAELLGNPIADVRAIEAGDENPRSAQFQPRDDFGPRLLFHDSRIFDGVDARQKATAMRLAAKESQAFGFQYLLCINDGDVPWERLEEDKVRSFVRRVLTDIGDGGLLGIRY